jgi:hypothetical protein
VTAFTVLVVVLLAGCYDLRHSIEGFPSGVDSRSHLERRCGFESDTRWFGKSLLSTKPSIRPSIGTENPIPEEMDHREIAVRVPVMNEVQFLFASEPCKPLKPRSLYVVFLVEKDVRVERRRTCNYLNHEEINGQYEVCTSSHQKHRNEEEGCIVAFVTAVRP